MSATAIIVASGQGEVLDSYADVRREVRAVRARAVFEQFTGPSAPEDACSINANAYGLFVL